MVKPVKKQKEPSKTPPAKAAVVAVSAADAKRLDAANEKLTDAYATLGRVRADAINAEEAAKARLNQAFAERQRELERVAARANVEATSGLVYSFERKQFEPSAA